MSRLTPAWRLVLLTLAVRLPLAWLVYGTDDVGGFGNWAYQLARGGNPYEQPPPLVWPPPWLLFTWIAFNVSDALPLPFSFVVKLVPIAADLVIVFLLMHAAPAYGRRPYATALAFALSPLSIYTSAVHGQFDSIPTLCATFAAILADRAEVRGAGVWAGVGAAFKSWPIVVLPAIVARARSLRQAIATCIVAVAIFLAATLLAWPYVGFTDALVRVAEYRSMPGWGGFSGLALIAGHDPRLPLFGWLFHAAAAAAALLILARRPAAVPGTLFLLLTVFVFMPGFAPHYYVWIVPLALLADRGRALVFTALAGAELLFEVLFRPFAGHIGDTVRLVPHAGYALAYGAPLDQRYTVLARLAVWAFLCYWWIAAAIGIARARRPA